MPARATHPVCDWDVDDNGCWIPRLRTNQDGYAQSHRGQYRRMVAHRAMWLHVGREIPEGMTLDHLCRVRNCCNPDHLEPVTQGENVNRGRKRKLSDADVEAILADTRPRPVIAAQYGVSREYVWRLQTGDYVPRA